MKREIEKKEFISFEDEFEKQKNQIYKQWLSFKLANEQRDDMLQAGKLGLHLAMQTYDNTKGAWASWMIMCIRREMINYINKEMRTVRLPNHQTNPNYARYNPNYPTHIFMNSLDEPLSEHSDITIVDTLEDPDTYEYEVEDNDPIKHLLKKYLDKLKPHYQVILQLRYIEQKKYKEIGEILGMTVENVCQHNNKAIKQLQKMFGVEQKIHTKRKQINSKLKIT